MGRSKWTELRTFVCLGKHDFVSAASLAYLINGVHFSPLLISLVRL